MQRIILAAVLTAILASPVALGEPIDDAEAAFSRGDYETAVWLFRPLAEQGDAAAQNRLGYMYRTGTGVPIDKAESLKWYQLAADQGSSLAKLNVSALTSDAVEDRRASLTPLVLNETLWQSLTESERTTLGSAYSISTISAKRVGEIVDVQMLNESTAGTTSGAELGSKIASDRYIDRAFSGDDWSYSAEKHTRSQIVGALLGSLVDSQPTESYHFRYTVKAADGTVQYVDEFKSDSFRRSAGECVDVSDLSSIGQDACESSVQRIRDKYLSGSDRGGQHSSTDGSTGAPAIAERLKVLDSLRKGGLISDAEYKTRRAEILSEI